MFYMYLGLGLRNLYTTDIPYQYVYLRILPIVIQY